VVALPLTTVSSVRAAEDLRLVLALVELFLAQPVNKTPQSSSKKIKRMSAVK
jgi:hypothetical protein